MKTPILREGEKPPKRGRGRATHNRWENEVKRQHHPKRGQCAQRPPSIKRLRGELLTAGNPRKYLIGYQIAAENKEQVNTDPTDDARGAKRRNTAHKHHVVVHENECDGRRTQRNRGHLRGPHLAGSILVEDSPFSLSELVRHSSLIAYRKRRMAAYRRPFLVIDRLELADTDRKSL